MYPHDITVTLINHKHCILMRERYFISKSKHQGTTYKYYWCECLLIQWILPIQKLRTLYNYLYILYIFTPPIKFNHLIDTNKTSRIWYDDAQHVKEHERTQEWKTTLSQLWMHVYNIGAAKKPDLLAKDGINGYCLASVRWSPGNNASTKQKTHKTALDMHIHRKKRD